MQPDDVRESRIRLGYSVPLFAEVLRVAPRLVREWESGARPVPEWLKIALLALMTRRDRSDS
jgi:DNA-binding transcriptional regulator YiaG